MEWGMKLVRDEDGRMRVRGVWKVKRVNEDDD